MLLCPNENFMLCNTIVNLRHPCIHSPKGENDLYQNYLGLLLHP